MDKPQRPMPANEAGENPEEEKSEGGAGEAIESIQEGFQQLSQMMQAAQGQVSPEDMKLFQAAVQATDTFIQSITSGAPQKPEPGMKQSGPMTANENAASRPSPNQGY